MLAETHGRWYAGGPAWVSALGVDVGIYSDHDQSRARRASHAEILFSFLETLGTAGNLTTDAHLAALAIEYRAELISCDTDFARFPHLRWRKPF